MSIGSNIKDLRKKRKLSQIELANKLNIEREVLVNWEHNLEIPNETQIMQIASILGVAYSDIVSSDQHIRSVQKAETEKMENLFTPYLQSGESLHWTGKPQSRLNFVTLPVTLFGLFFLGFALFWTIAAMQTALEMAFFGIPFIVVGFFLVFGKKTWMKRISGHVYYGVTNKRILILTRGQQIAFSEIALESLSNVVLSPGIKGTSSITFYVRNESIFNHKQPFFYSIENGPDVVNLINELRQKRLSSQ